MNEAKIIVEVKKQYVSPLISEFGNIRSITAVVGMTGKKDSTATTGNNKTF